MSAIVLFIVIISCCCVCLSIIAAIKYKSNLLSSLTPTPSSVVTPSPSIISPSPSTISPSPTPSIFSPSPSTILVPAPAPVVVPAPAAPAPAVVQTYNVSYTSNATVTNGTLNLGSFTVPANFHTGISMVVTFTGTTNPVAGPRGWVILIDSSNNGYFSSVINSSPNFNVSTTYTTSAFPADFTAGAVFTVQESISYQAWYILSGAVATFTLTYT